MLLCWRHQIFSTQSFPTKILQGQPFPVFPLFQANSPHKNGADQSLARNRKMSGGFSAESLHEIGTVPGQVCFFSGWSP